MFELPYEIVAIIQDFSRPLTRVDWKNGSPSAKALKSSSEWKDFEFYGYIYATYYLDEGFAPLKYAKFDATFAYEWANDKWYKKIHESYNINNNPHFVDHITKMEINTNKMRWFWFNEPYYNFLPYDFSKKIWHINSFPLL